jgi:hypothetical protein
VVGKAEMIFVLLRMRNPELVAVVESRSLHYTGFPFRDPGSGRDDEVWVVYPALGFAPDAVPRFVTVPIESASVAACLLVSRNRPRP